MYFGTLFSVSLSYAHMRTYSTVGMRFRMIKAKRSRRSLECVHLLLEQFKKEV